MFYVDSERCKLDKITQRIIGCGHNKRVGLLMNFHAAVLKNGLKRVANNF